MPTTSSTEVGMCDADITLAGTLAHRMLPGMEAARGVGPGDRVRARTAEGDWVTLRALTSAQPGQDFPIVWVSEDGWEKANDSDAQNMSRIPWPADAIS